MYIYFNEGVSIVFDLQINTLKHKLQEFYVH